MDPTQPESSRLACASKWWALGYDDDDAGTPPKPLCSFPLCPPEIGTRSTTNNQEEGECGEGRHRACVNEWLPASVGPGFALLKAMWLSAWAQPTQATRSQLPAAEIPRRSDGKRPDQHGRPSRVPFIPKGRRRHLGYWSQNVIKVSSIAGFCLRLQISSSLLHRFYPTPFCFLADPSRPLRDSWEINTTTTHHCHLPSCTPEHPRFQKR